MTATLAKWGNSQAVRLPKIVIKELDINENDEFDIIVTDDSIILKKAKPKIKRKSISERFAGFKGEYENINIDFGEAQGGEVW